MINKNKCSNKVVTFLKPRGAYIAKIKRGLPVAYDEETLANVLGTTSSNLLYLSSCKDSLYTTFYIDKFTKEVVKPADRLEGRSYRQIDAPAANLKVLQRSVVTNIVDMLPKHKANFAYMGGKSIGDACNANMGDNDVTVALDLENFFNTHGFGRIARKLYKKTGYPYAVCKLLASIATYKGTMPQGAVTSPLLSVVLNYELDEDLEALAEAHGFSYTRYADDMHFSAKHKTNQECGELIRAAYSIISKHKFRVKASKTRILRNKASIISAGLVFKGSPAKLKEFNAALATFMAYNPKIFEEFHVKVHTNKTEVFLRDRAAILSGIFYEKVEETKKLKELAEEHGLSVTHKSWYNQSIRSILGLYLTNRVKYPTVKYKKLRVEAMLCGLGLHHDTAKFSGIMAYVNMVDKETYNKLRKVVEKYDNKRKAGFVKSSSNS